MKRILVCAALAGLLSLAAAPVRALDCQTTILIPERYTLAICPNVTPETKLEEKAVLEAAKAVKERDKVEQVGFAFYAPGKKQGDGVIAAGFYNGNDKESYLITPPDEEKAKGLEKTLGYIIAPNDLWKIYDDNEVVADEDFKGKPVLLQVKCTGLAKDALGKAYLKVPLDEFGLKGLQIYLSKDDPFLRKLKKGQNLMVRAYPKKYLMQSVMLDGEVVMIEEPQAKAKGKKK